MVFGYEINDQKVFVGYLIIEEAMEQGYTVMDITKVGEGFSLSYDIKPIE